MLLPLNRAPELNEGDKVEYTEERGKKGLLLHKFFGKLGGGKKILGP